MIWKVYFSYSCSLKVRFCFWKPLTQIQFAIDCSSLFTSTIYQIRYLSSYACAFDVCLINEELAFVPAKFNSIISVNFSNLSRWFWIFIYLFVIFVFWSVVYPIQFCMIWKFNWNFLYQSIDKIWKIQGPELI